MKFIAHRGNFLGVDKRENDPLFIIETIKRGYDVEIDVWKRNDFYYLGHDGPEYPTSIEFLEDIKEHAWVHCKNISAMASLCDKMNCFFHDVDDAVFTSKGFIWIYPGKEIPKEGKSVVVLKGDYNYTEEELNRCYAICTDNIKLLEGLT
jgi:hypothetical protein